MRADDNQIGPGQVRVFVYFFSWRALQRHDRLARETQLRGGVHRDEPFGVLSDRELEVFRLIGEGHGTRRIADELHLSVKTVESYQAHIKEKFGLQSSRDLVQRAIEWRLAETAK